MSLLLFRWYPPVAADRHHPEGADARLGPATTFLTQDQFDAQWPPVEDGDYVIFESKGEVGKDGVQPRFELKDRIRVLPVEPAKTKTAKVKAFGD